MVCALLQVVVVGDPLLGATTSRVLLSRVLRPVLVSCCTASGRHHASARAVGVTGAADMSHDSVAVDRVVEPSSAGACGDGGGGAAGRCGNVRLRRCDLGRHRLLVAAPVDGVLASSTSVSGGVQSGT